MREKDFITVYWSPASFKISQESWNMLYQEPVSLKKEMHDSTKSDSLIRRCPAVKDLLQNIFVIKSNIDDDFIIPTDIVDQMIDQNAFDSRIPIDNAKVAMSLVRKPEYKDYYNYGYNLSWLLFADEPVEMRMTSPWFPAKTPLKDAILAPGQLDIGRWYRSINLEYLTPKESSHFSINSGDPIVYFEFFTDKKIVFKRYMVNDALGSMAREFPESPGRYGRFKKLIDRYDMARRTKIPEMILSEIKKNLVD